MQVVNTHLQAFLSNNPSESEITDFINNFPIDLKPQRQFWELNTQEAKVPIAVYVNLMVQDIGDSYYYYSLIIRKPICSQSKFFCFKFGNQPFADPQILEDDSYIKVMTDREIARCTPVCYQTNWAKKLHGNFSAVEAIDIVFDGKCPYKLGEVFHAVCIYHPETLKLYFVRAVGEQEVKIQNLNYMSNYLNKSIDIPKTREKIIDLFLNFCSERQSEHLLYTMISKECMFLSCGSNLKKVVEELLPRVMSLQIKAPFKDSFFPYKNEQGKLMQAPMQMAMLPTFVILDFSRLSQEQQVMIQQEEIDNLKALKLFVQEGKTIYRWEIGESILPHRHIGLIIKGSNIVSPQHLLLNEKIDESKFQLVNALSEETKLAFRSYFEAVREIDASLTPQSRKDVEAAIAKETTGNQALNGDLLNKKLSLSRLRAQSFGRSEVLEEDFAYCSKMIY